MIPLRLPLMAALLLAPALATSQERLSPDRLQPPELGAKQDAPQNPIDETTAKLDMVMVRQGAPRQGYVERLAAGVLNLATTDRQTVAIPKANLVAINFAIGALGAGAAAPGDFDPAKDLIFTYDGQVTNAKVNAITKDKVIAEGTTLARGKVDLILFSQDERQGASAIPAGSAGDKPEDGNGKKADAHDAPPKVTDTGPLKDRRNPCPPDKPLGGRTDWESEVRTTYCDPMPDEVRLWFRLVPDERPLPPAVAEQMTPDPAQLALALRFRGTDFYLKATRKECAPAPIPGRVCHSDSFTFVGTPDNAGAWFSPLAPHLATSVFLNFGNYATVVCKYETGFVTRTPGGLNTGITISPQLPSEGHYLRRISPGPCWKKDAPNEPTDECLADPAQFAAIPFSGEWAVNKPAGGTLWSKMEWEVCCGCGEHPRAPGPVAAAPSPPEKEDCNELALASRRHYDREIERLRNGLASAAQRVERHRQEMIHNTEGFKAAMATCLAEDVALAAMVAVALNLIGVRPAGGALPALPPNAVWLRLQRSGVKHYSVYEIKQALMALGIFVVFNDVAKSVFGARDVGAMKDRLFSCAGAGRTPPGTYDAALDFVQNFEALLKAAGPMYEAYNRLVRLEIEAGFENEKAARRCVACAREQGRDPIPCGAERSVYTALELFEAQTRPPSYRAPLGRQ